MSPSIFEDDWRFALVLKDIKQQWAAAVQSRPDYFAVIRQQGICEEEADSPLWVLDKSGVREISGAEYRSYIKDRSKGHRHCLFSEFSIDEVRNRVWLEFHFAPLSGCGAHYLIKGEGKDAKLETDPKGDFMIS